MYESEFEENLYQLRRDKRHQIAAILERLNPGLPEAAAVYPNSFPIDPALDIPAIRARYDKPEYTAEALEAHPISVTLAGRLMAIRVQGKAGFAQLQQGGQRLQIYIRKDDVGDDLFALYKLLDLGDHIGVRGTLMRTRTGELSVHARNTSDGPALTFLAKAMLALPDKYHGLEDTELRYRQRYVDLFMNTAQPAKPAEGEAASPAEEEIGDVREVFVKRAAILRAIRKFFDARGYLEVETPMLHTVAGGAAARPFKTHHNALDIPLSLRIAPELFLKRLVVGGLDRVYEINRNFRNEGVSTRHNPEFTMLEFYQAYANYHDLMNLTEELIQSVAMEVNGTLICNFNGNKIDLGKWQKLSMREAIIKWWPTEWNQPTMKILSNEYEMRKWLDRFQSEHFKFNFIPSQNEDDKEEEVEEPIILSAKEEAEWERERREPGSIRWQAIARAIQEYYLVLDGKQPFGKAISNLFEAIAEEHLIQPTIIYDFPLAVSPLSKQKPEEPDWVERFEFYIGGFEVGNAFSELNDPDEQYKRFADQLKERDRGDDEAHQMDEDYVRALGYGLPPTGGEGIGIDRLTMVLTGAKSIRDVILFPLMRPLAKASDAGEPHAQPQTEPYK